jgi:DNA-directed RNA polymerase specialized sigma24 family protein
LKKPWIPTQDTFRQFLEWLDQGSGSSGETYLELRRRLVLYFDRRNCRTADELADETLSRMAQTFQEKGMITNLSPAHYCYVTARFVFLEYTRGAERNQASLEDVPASRWENVAAAQPGTDAESTTKELTLGCLERCLEKLAPAERELILEYYQGEQQEKIQRRKQIAQRLGVSANALSIRACRIRDRLEACVRSCREEDRSISFDSVL